MIPPHLRRLFPPEIRSRGDGYFAEHRARVLASDAYTLKAHVRGSVSYVVDLASGPGELSVACSCPHAARNGACKHIWATLRQADAMGRLDPLLRTTGHRFEVFARVDGDVVERHPDLDADANGARLVAQRALTPKTRDAPSAPTWKALIAAVREETRHFVPPPSAHTPPVWPDERRIIYVVDIPASARTFGLAVDVLVERRDRDGNWGAPGQLRLPAEVWHAAPDPRDRQIAQMLLGAPAYAPPHNHRTTGFVLGGLALGTTLRLMCETGRCRPRLTPQERPLVAAEWDDGPPWEMHLRITRTGDGACALGALLRRDDEEMPLNEPVLLHTAGVMLARGAFARFAVPGAFAWVTRLRENAPIRVRESELSELLEALYAVSPRPHIELPPDAQVTELHEPPRPGVSVHTHESPWKATRHRIDLFFLYGAARVQPADADSSVFDRERRVLHHRDHAAEARAHAVLTAAGAREEHDYINRRKAFAVSEKRLAHLVPALVADGWQVEAEGAVIRAASLHSARVRSGVDWFELDAGVRFGEIDVPLHELLDARRKGATSILLSDGTRGLLPADWLAQLGPLMSGGKLVGGALRYTRSQAGLLDALLATLPDADTDAAFEKAREQLRSFDRVTPAAPPRTFRGTLREYQREGLGWFNFLRAFSLGGCLADDMGLGKTVQVLALLDARRGTPSRPAKPSIVVVPRSLVFNWIREAERFTPRLRMLDYTGVGRSPDAVTSGDIDVVITTYGTLRRDAAALASVLFDYAILDEAQAIKTSTAAATKAARVLRADHRLALTGTPIENRIEELWSLFEFLNPGMLGGSTSFAALARRAPTEPGGITGRDVLARALRPVILRRTKAQVAPELPERIEQTLTVDLEGAQRKYYDQLLTAYRRSVLERVDSSGLGKAKMHILEALLRLRQAACHPALADPRRTSAPSAKLDALMPALDELVSEGNKALVFSQFTSFLSLVRERLDSAGVRYEYLDGRTRDRQARVDRFQTDDTCPLFLISLKAGGHGLNLTAADYVFILDPWWNPAVEAQAIDRAHRIGQTRRVIATRIVARDTIEEKILALQASKRALADAILGQDQGVLAGIGRAELEMLLS